MFPIKWSTYRKIFTWFLLQFHNSRVVLCIISGCKIVIRNITNMIAEIMTLKINSTIKNKNIVITKKHNEFTQ